MHQWTESSQVHVMVSCSSSHTFLAMLGLKLNHKRGIESRWHHRNGDLQNLLAHQMLTYRTAAIGSVETLGKIFIGPTCKLLLSFVVISDIQRSFIPNTTTFTKDCRVRQYLENVMGLEGRVNATVYKTDPNFTVLGMANCPNFNTELVKQPCRVSFKFYVYQNLLRIHCLPPTELTLVQVYSWC